MPQNELVNVTNGLQGVPSRPAATRMISHPGSAQKLLKRMMPKTARRAIRLMIEGPKLPMPKLAETDKRALRDRYGPQRPQIERMTGLELTAWQDGRGRQPAITPTDS